MSDKNIKLKKGFKQVCVWPGTVLGKGKVKEFEAFIAQEFNGVKAQYLEEIKTGPDSTGPGGRNDLFFAIRTKDVGKFAVPRLAVGIRWIEDVYGNGGGNLYPARVKEYKSW